MSEQTFFVLSALAHEPLHGYGILSVVEDLSHGRILLSVGTLYGILDRADGSRLIEVDREEVVASRLRRYYRLTEQGRTALSLEAQRQAANAEMAARRLGGWAAPGAATGAGA